MLEMIAPSRCTGLAVICLILAAIGCTGGHDSPAPRPSPATQAAAAGRVIELPRRTLVFEPSRPDVTVGCAVLYVASSHPVGFNGVVGPNRWNYVYLRQVGTNRFELPPLRIEFAPDGPETIGCLTVKVWFNEVTNYSDSRLYENLEDRYSLLSWCTTPPESFKDTSYRSRFSQHHASTLPQFIDRLSEPFPIRLKPTPLEKEWGYPQTRGSAADLSADQVVAIERIMRDRGERHLISIVGLDATHAAVEAGIKDMTRHYGTRRYELVLDNGAWRVESVSEEPNIGGN